MYSHKNRNNYEKKCDEGILGACEALRIHKGGRLKARVVDCKGSTLHAYKEVLLLRILEDGRKDLSKGDGYYQSAIHTTDQRGKDYATDTTGLLRYGEERVAFIQEVESCKNLDVV